MCTAPSSTSMSKVDGSSSLNVRCERIAPRCAIRVRCHGV
jgi:hypothetical protein